MRTAILLILIMAVQSDAAERTWTIARDVYQADGELIAVRGDVAYLKIDGNVEEIPIERLSALDQHYIASLSLAPILPGPANAASDSESTVLRASTSSAEEMPLPGPPDPPRSDGPTLREPELAPAFGGVPIRQPGATQPPSRFDRYGRTVPPQFGPPQPGTPANYLAPQGNPQGNWGDNYDSNVRRSRRAQQEQNERDSRAQRNDNDEDRGIFGFRARRQERERAAASRER